MPRRTPALRFALIERGNDSDAALGNDIMTVALLVWCPKSNLKKFRMDFVPRQGERRVKAGGLRGMPRAGLNARNLLRAGTEGHGRAMATPSNEAFGAKDAEIIQGIFGTPH